MLYLTSCCTQDLAYSDFLNSRLKRTRQTALFVRIYHLHRAYSLRLPKRTIQTRESLWLVAQSSDLYQCILQLVPLPCFVFDMVQIFLPLFAVEDQIQTNHNFLGTFLLLRSESKLPCLDHSCLDFATSNVHLPLQFVVMTARFETA